MANEYEVADRPCGFRFADSVLTLPTAVWNLIKAPGGTGAQPGLGKCPGYNPDCRKRGTKIPPVTDTHSLETWQTCLQRVLNENRAVSSRESPEMSIAKHSWFRDEHGQIITLCMRINLR